MCRQRRVLVTQDADFLRKAHSDPDHPGVAFCPRDERTLGQIIRSLVLIYGVLAPDEMRGRIEFL